MKLKKWVWIFDGDTAFIIHGRTYNDAYKSVIQHRLDMGNTTREEAEERFGRNDYLLPLSKLEPTNIKKKRHT